MSEVNQIKGSVNKSKNSNKEKPKDSPNPNKWQKRVGKLR